MADDYKANAKASQEAKLALIVPVKPEEAHRMTDQDHRDFHAESWRMATPDQAK